MNRYALIRALHSSHLEQRGDRTCAIDYIGAMGFAGRHDEIQPLLLRIKYATPSVGDIEKAAARIARDLTRPGQRTPKFLRHLSAGAIVEWMFDRCPTCNGTGKTGSNWEGATPETICHDCKGTGRFSSLPPKRLTHERSIVCKMDEPLFARVEDTYKAALSKIHYHDSLIEAAAKLAMGGRELLIW